jgi:hypothetical protein
MNLVAALGREPLKCGFLPKAATNSRFMGREILHRPFSGF